MADYTYTPVGQDSYFDCSTYSDYVFASITNNTGSPLTIRKIQLYLSSGKGTFTAGSHLTGNGKPIVLQVGITNSSNPESASYYDFSSNSHTITNTVTPISGGWPDYSQMTTPYSFDCSTSIPAKTTYYFTWHIFTEESTGNVFCWDYHVESVEIETESSSTVSIANAKIAFDLSEGRTVLYNSPSGTVSVSNVKVTLNGTNITDSVSLRYSFNGGNTYGEAASSGFGYIKKKTTVVVKVRALGNTSKGYSGTADSETKTATIKCKLRPPKSVTLSSSKGSPVLYKTTTNITYNIEPATDNPEEMTIVYKGMTFSSDSSNPSTITGDKSSKVVATINSLTNFVGTVYYIKDGYENSAEVRSSDTPPFSVKCKLRPPTIDSFTSGASTSPIMYGTAHTLQCKASTNSISPSGVTTKTFGYPTMSLPGTSPQTTYTAQAQSTKSGYIDSDTVTKQLTVTYKLNPPTWNINWQNTTNYDPNYSFTCYSEFVYTLDSGTSPSGLSEEYQRLWYNDDGSPKKTSDGKEDWKSLSSEEWKTYTQSLFVQGKSGLVSVKARYTKAGYTSSEYTQQLVHVCYSPRCSEYTEFKVIPQVQDGSNYQDIKENSFYDKNRKFKLYWSAFPLHLGIGRFNYYQVSLIKVKDSATEEVVKSVEGDNIPSESNEVVLDLSQEVSGTYRLKLVCICENTSGVHTYDSSTGVIVTSTFKILSSPSFTVLYPVVGSDANWYTMNPRARVIFQNDSPDGITNLSVSVNGSSYPYQMNSLHYFSKEDLKPQLSEITSTQKIDFTSPEGSVSPGPQKFSITMTNPAGSFTKEFTLNLLSFSYQIKSSGKAAYVEHLTEDLSNILSNYTKYYQGSSAKSLLTDQNQVQHEVIKQKPFIDTLNALKTLYENVSEDSVPPSSFFRDLNKIDLSVSPKEVLLESDSTSASDPPSFTIWEEEVIYLPIGNYFNYILYILKNML